MDLTLNLQVADGRVNNLLLIPNHFFVPDIIEKRPPLKETARRAGWVGCNIEIGNIPESGKIFIIQNSRPEEKRKVMDQSRRALSLHTKRLETRGWMMDILKCIERIPTERFRLEEVYAFAGTLQQRHPENRHVKDKIRQQLQFLRDKGFIEFTARGVYRKL